ncbi:MAG: glycoside hydrolase family 3 N-terminal domain-containing protein [Mangrovibacterium sp.]
MINFKQQLLFILGGFLFLTTSAHTKPEFLNYLNDPWVNSTFNSLSLEQKIAQLFIAQAYSNDSQTDASALNLVKNNQVGGVIFMQGTVENQANSINSLQKVSKIPLLICTDGEWGPGMRMKNYPNYPYQMTLGALENDSLIYRMGKEIGYQFRRMGVHVNFAPVSDVNNNPNNPVINYRSFGEDPLNVAHKAWNYAQGMEDEKVLAVIKHFPGHGDTNVDSHIGLPVINHTRAHLDSVELRPFREMINGGISALMTGHIQIPALEPDPKIPATLSENIIQQLLKKELEYEGFIFTDAMNMSGVTKHYEVGEAAVRAIKAGNDMLEIVPNVPVAIQAVMEAVKNGTIKTSDIDYHCRRVLALKKWLELDKECLVKMENLKTDISKPIYAATRRQLHAQSLTALINKNDILPIQRLDTMKIASVSIGKTTLTPFQQILGRYTKVSHFNLAKNASNAEVDALISKLKDYNVIITGIHGLRLMPSNDYGVTSTMSYFMEKASTKPLVVSLFGNPYALDKIKNVNLASALLVSYQDNDDAQELAAQAVFGAIGINGKLPVGVNSFFKLNSGISIPEISRLKYSLPEEINISSPKLIGVIDSIAFSGIKNRAYPGCQVLIAIDGRVILNKAYGTHTYESNDSVRLDHIYDIASVTKIASVTPALMKLIDDKKFNLNYPLSFYYPPFRNTDKDKINAREVLTHQARLPKWIPFWSNILTREGGNFQDVFHAESSLKDTIEVAKNMYINDKTRDLVYQIIKETPLRPQAKYAYSDLGFIVYASVIEELVGTSFPSYLNTSFYAPLGANSITYNPLQSVSIDMIPPTEKDNAFRKQVVQGHVHDEAAAMLGGVSGNAGLFANANDLAKLMQMYAQYGSYGGVQYIDSTTIAEFTKCQFPKNGNRRALGFDRAEYNSSSMQASYPSSYATPESFGHTGFTGTMVWIDPVKKITFIFLSNRTYPNRSTNLSKYAIRGNMLDAIYEAQKKGL